MFFGENDTRLIAISSRANAGSTAWRSFAYCLTPNHVHLILVPDREQALGRALGERRRRYRSTINARLRVTGHLFQARFGSVATDEERLMAAARYVALSPCGRGLSNGRRTGAGRAFPHI